MNSYKMFCANTNVDLVSSENTIHIRRIQTSRISSITVDNGPHIEFTYINGQQETYTDGHKIKQSHCDSVRLNDIKIYSNIGKITKLCKFNYTVEKPTGSKNSATFLQSIFLSGEGTFSFEYNINQIVPPLATSSYDHWGYYNGNNTGFKSALSDNISFSENLQETVKGKDPDWEFALLGTMKKITYPTGGFSNIFYEAHSYSTYLKRDSSTTYLPVLTKLPENRTTGGVRINKIITATSESQISDTTEYLYTNKSGLSSGILINTPRYGIKYITGNKFVEYYNLATSMYDANSTHIEYSSIIERKRGYGSTTYVYTSSVDS